MQSVPLFNQRFRKICSLLFICLISTLLLSTSMVLMLHTHEHDNVAGCLRTLDPVCACDNDGTLISVGSQEDTRIAAQSGVQLQSRNDTKTNCLTCAMILKVVNPLRYIGSTVNSLLLADINLFASTALLLLIVLFGFLTPIELKTKNTN